MDVISNFLGRFKNLKVKDRDLKLALTQAIKKEATIIVPVEAVNILHGVAYLDLLPIERSEIFLHKPAILGILASNNQRILDIR